MEEMPKVLKLDDIFVCLFEPLLSDWITFNIQFTGIQRITRKGHLHCCECCTQTLPYTTYLPGARTPRNREIFHYRWYYQGDIKCKLQHMSRQM